MKVKVISLPYIFQVLYVLCFIRSRYQVSVYRTNGPLVFYFLIIILLQLLDAEIRAHLLEKIGKPIDSQVHEVAMYLRYRGNYTDIVAEFLLDKGF